MEDSWPNLFEKLEKGEIDLLADVSYKPEREEFLSYPDLPMGSETYYIYIHAGNDELRPDDLSFAHLPDTRRLSRATPALCLVPRRCQPVAGVLGVNEEWNPISTQLAGLQIQPYLASPLDD